MKHYIIKSYQLSLTGTWELHVQAVDSLSDALNWIAYLESEEDTMFDSMNVVIDNEEN